MKEKNLTLFTSGMIWFGAGVSIAEIVTGTYFAPMGMAQGLKAIIIGHIIGGILLFLAAYIGARAKVSAMETVKFSFGHKGGLLFAFLNVIQLVGWTSIMIYDGALAANEIFNTGIWLWALVIGALIVVWIIADISRMDKLSTAAMGLLFILTVILCKVIFFGDSSTVHTSTASADAMSFGTAIELAIAMPLSWLPVISDYTRAAEKPKEATIVSCLTYTVISSWMYIIGMGAAIFTGESNIALIMVKAGLGMAGLLIVIISTVTTTFLDAFSAGVSSESIHSALKGKQVGAVVAVVGTVLAILFNMDNITSFLYIIGSVFAPMAAVLISDYYILKVRSVKCAFNMVNLIVWAVGFAFYRYMLTQETFVGNTVPVIIATAILHLIANKVFSRSRGEELIRE